MKNKIIFVSVLMGIFLSIHLLVSSKESDAVEKYDLKALVDSLDVDSGKINFIVINGESLKEQKPDKTSCLSPIHLMLIIVIGGAFGGFVDGLKSENDYAINFGNKKWRIGTLGSVFVGATASIAIFTVVDAVFNVKLNFELSDSKEFIKLVAWTVLSGYVGPRLLNPLSEAFVKKVAAESVRRELNTIQDVNENVKISMEKAAQKLSEYDGLKIYDKYKDPSFDFEFAKKILDEAKMNYDLALESNPSDLTGLIGKARVLRRMAELAGYKDDEGLKIKYWDQAMSILNQLVKSNPDSSRVLYNRACYLIALGKKEDAKADLEKAIKIQPGLKIYARKDRDFISVRKESWFEGVTE